MDIALQLTTQGLSQFIAWGHFSTKNEVKAYNLVCSVFSTNVQFYLQAEGKLRCKPWFYLYQDKGLSIALDKKVNGWKLWRSLALTDNRAFESNADRFFSLAVKQNWCLAENYQHWQQTVLALSRKTDDFLPCQTALAETFVWMVGNVHSIALDSKIRLWYLPLETI